MGDAFRFIDLFAGIGGMRIAFEDLGGRCVFASEIEEHAAKVYEDNFSMKPQHDITTLNPESTDELPEFDILLGGFPCQAFSMAGNREGFNDDRGKMFNYIDKILEKRHPDAFLLENVKGLISHNKGETMGYIIHRLEELKYDVKYEVLNAADFNVPQKRERVYIVGFKKDLKIDDFEFPEPWNISDKERKTLKSIRTTSPVPADFFLSQGYLDCLKKHKVEQHAKGRGFSYEILDDSDVLNTILGGGMGRERDLMVDHNLVSRETKNRRKTPLNSENVRMMTPKECLRAQGFPEDFKLDVPKTSAYKLVGNSVAVDVVYLVGLKMMQTLHANGCIESYSVRDPDSDKYKYDLSRVE